MTGPRTLRTLGEAEAAAVGARLAAVDEPFGFTTAPPTAANSSTGGTWVRLDQVSEPGVSAEPSVFETIATALRHRTGTAQVAGSYLCGRLLGSVAGRATAALVLGAVVPTLAPSTVHLHVDADQRVRSICFTGDVLGGVDVADTIVAERWAIEITTALAPGVEAIRSRFPYGRRGMWGAVADRVAATAVAADRAIGGAGEAGWQVAEQLLATLSEHAPVSFTRPTAQVVEVDGRALWFVGKGTCCLAYRTVDDPCPSSGRGYCTSCPLTTPACRRRRFAASASG
ncbi:MAG: (2Fe-2S)-binding protein [Acidimicrobiia bacterium]|nr:(2Fe-2S)-binding protein [Acidimicrobiia bacterium]